MRKQRLSRSSNKFPSQPRFLKPYRDPHCDLEKIPSFELFERLILILLEVEAMEPEHERLPTPQQKSDAKEL